VRTLDTQTPQVLIETRIVEASTTFLRDLGIQWGGTLNMSPANGSPTGLVFPNMVGVAGGADDKQSLNTPTPGQPTPTNYAVNFPPSVSGPGSSSIGMTFAASATSPPSTSDSPPPRAKAGPRRCRRPSRDA